jgi:hypothetical protein
MLNMLKELFMKLNVLLLGVVTIPPLSWSQTVSGAFQSAFQMPGQIWNNNFAAMMDYNAGIFRVWWACGTGNTDGICYGYVGSARVMSTNWLDDCSSPSHRPGAAFEPTGLSSYFQDPAPATLSIWTLPHPTLECVTYPTPP